MTNKPIFHLTEQHLAVLVSPRTREVLAAFRRCGPLTVKQAQDELQWPSKSVYYQIDKLLKVGLLVEAGSVMGSRRDCSVFEAVAGEIRIPDGFQGASYEKLTAKNAAATLGAATRRFRDAADESPARPELVDDLYLYTQSIKVTGEGMVRLKKEIGSIIGKYRLENGEEGRLISLTFVMTPHQSRLKPRQRDS